MGSACASPSSSALMLPTLSEPARRNIAHVGDFAGDKKDGYDVVSAQTTRTRENLPSAHDFVGCFLGWRVIGRSGCVAAAKGG